MKIESYGAHSVGSLLSADRHSKFHLLNEDIAFRNRIAQRISRTDVDNEVMEFYPETDEEGEVLPLEF